MLVGIGVFLVGIALFCWREGSGYGLLIAWVFGAWGLMLLAWGLLAGWHRNLLACLAGSACALSSVLVALLCVQFEWWEMAILCAVGSGLALTFGVFQVVYLLRPRA